MRERLTTGRPLDWPWSRRRTARQFRFAARAAAGRWSGHEEYFLPNPVSGRGMPPNSSAAAAGEWSRRVRLTPAIAMNLRLPLFTTLLAVLCVLPARAGNPEFLLGLKSAMVEYQVSTSGRGADSSGVDTMWVDDYGRKSARLQKHVQRGGKNQTENLGLLTDGWIYTIDLKKKTGMKMSLEQAMAMAKRFGKGAQGQDGQAFVKDFVEKNGGKILPPEEFLGRMCDVFEVWGCKTWAFKGVALKTEGTVMGIKTSMVATKFEENPSIPASRFEVPAGVKIEDMPDLGAMLGGMMSGRPPAGGDEADAPRKSPKPAPKKPAVEEPTPDAPVPVVKPKPAPKLAPKAETSGVRLTGEEFQAVVAKIHVSGYTTMAPESAGGGHTVNLINSRGAALGVTVLPLAIAEQLEKNPSIKLDPKFDHQGHAAISGVLPDSDEGDSSIVLVRYPERKLALLLSSNPVQPKEELLKLLEQIDL